MSTPQPSASSNTLQIITVVFFSVYGHAFGRKRLGLIQGAAQLLTVLASASGPLLLAACGQWLGSYDPLFYAGGPLAALLGLAAWRVPLPRPPRPQNSST